MAEDVKTVQHRHSGQGSREKRERASLQALKITMDKRADLAVSVFIVILGVVVLILARKIRAGTIPDPITSRGLPNMMSGFLIVGGIALAVQQLLHWSDLPGHLVPEEGQEDEKGYPASAVRAISLMAVSLLWGWLLTPLGFLIVMPVYLVICAWVMGTRPWTKVLIFSVIYTISSWLIFGPFMGIRFPLGPLGPLARSLGLVP